MKYNLLKSVFKTKVKGLLYLLQFIFVFRILLATILA